MTDIKFQQLPLQSLAASCLAFSQQRIKLASQSKQLLYHIELANNQLLSQTNPLIRSDQISQIHENIALLAQILIRIKSLAKNLQLKAGLLKFQQAPGSIEDLQRALKLCLYVESTVKWVETKQWVLEQLVGRRWDSGEVRVLVVAWGSETWLRVDMQQDIGK